MGVRSYVWLNTVRCIFNGTVIDFGEIYTSTTVGVIADNFIERDESRGSIGVNDDAYNKTVKGRTHVVFFEIRSLP